MAGRAGKAGRAGWAGAILVLAFLAAGAATALAQTQQQPPPEPVRLVVPPVTVTATKEPADAQTLPLSVTAVSKDTISSDGIAIISDAGIYAPNTYFSEFSARKLSFPHFRGISSGPGNPAITTYIDGVPQLHTNASSVDLLDVDQVELVRGPQSALFGRNALGGLVNVLSARPSIQKWTGAVVGPFGNFGAKEVRGAVSGPIAGGLAISLAAGRGERDGYTKNDVTGRTIDDRSTTLGKVQVLWAPSPSWEARAIVNHERARDGDYALQDLGALRSNPFHAARDFEGHTNRDVTSTTVLARHASQRVVLTSTTGVVRWNSEDATDLDYTPLPLVTRTNNEKSWQFTQEVRLASGATAARLSDLATLRWQGGVFVFANNYDQAAINRFSPFVLNPALGIPVIQHSPNAALDDSGVGLYGQGTITLRTNLDVTVGARVDHESKSAVLDTFLDPAIGPPSHTDTDRSFSDVSPQFAAAYRLTPGRIVYATVGRGYKSGGFNAASPAGTEAFGEEHAWHVEGGTKTSWASGKVLLNVAVFHINWDDLQLNVPNPAVPAQFYIANVGRAATSGAEVELTARPKAGLDVFGVFGATRAKFGDGSRSSGVDVSGHDLPTSPGYTATFGAQYTRAAGSRATMYGRGEAVLYGSFFYDDFNSAKQDAYGLLNLRAGVRAKYVFGEAWVRNASNTRYIPIAFPYGSPSGFVGEMGAPRTFGLRAGVTF